MTEKTFREACNLSKMGFGAAFRRAVRCMSNLPVLNLHYFLIHGSLIRTQIYVEPVMVWSLMMYGASISIAVVTPSLRPFVDTAEKKTPPSLKEVRALTVKYMPLL